MLKFPAYKFTYLVRYITSPKDWARAKCDSFSVCATGWIHYQLLHFLSLHSVLSVRRSICVSEAVCFVISPVSIDGSVHRCVRGYMFRDISSIYWRIGPSVCRRLYVSVISPVSIDRSVHLCVGGCMFRDISSMYWRIFTKLLSLMNLGTKMNWLGFGVKRSKVKVTLSRRRRPALDVAVGFRFLVAVYCFLWWDCHIDLSCSGFRTTFSGLQLKKVVHRAPCCKF